MPLKRNSFACTWTQPPNGWCNLMLGPISWLHPLTWMPLRCAYCPWKTLCTLREYVHTLHEWLCVPLAEGSLMRSCRIRFTSQLPKSCMYLANSCFVHVAPRWCTMLNLDLSILRFLCHSVENQNQGLPSYLLLAPGSAATSLKHFDAGPIRTSLLFWTTPHHRDAKSIRTGICWHVLAPA
jgi:hypothetical protein